MNTVNERDLIHLDILVYLDGVCNGQTVETIVKRFLKDDGEYFERLNRKVSSDEKHTYPTGMDKTEWLKCLEDILNNPNIKHLKVKDLKDYGIGIKLNNGDKNTGFKAMTFVNETTNDAIVTFRGTSTNHQWTDNAVAIYSIETFAQLEALEYINKSRFNEFISVSGHSKGGNLAHFVAIMSDKVKYAVSFAGPGFSKAFFIKHQYNPVFINSQKKLVSIVSDRDIAGGILFQACPPENIYFFNSGNSYRIWQLSMYHKPSEVFANESNFDENGRIVNKSVPSTRIYCTHKISQGLSRMDKDVASNISHLLVRGLRKIPL
jgi:hypothetical protein